MPIRIRCEDGGKHRAQMREAESVIGIPPGGSAACYADRRLAFRSLCGSV